MGIYPLSNPTNPLPNILDKIDQVGGAEYFSTFDLIQGFFQIPMKEEDKYLTAFAAGQGLYQFRRMAMGLSNSPSTFQRGVVMIFRDMQDKDIFIYLDDAVIYDKTIEKHNDKLERFLNKVRKIKD